MKDTDKTNKRIGKERRKSQRVDIELEIEYSDLENFCQDYARNLSLGGLFVETRQPLKVGSELKLAFRLPGYPNKILSSGRVVRATYPEDTTPTNRRPGMAIQFDDLSEESKAIIDALVRESLEQS